MQVTIEIVAKFIYTFQFKAVWRELLKRWTEDGIPKSKKCVTSFKSAFNPNLSEAIISYWIVKLCLRRMQQKLMELGCPFRKSCATESEMSRY